MKICIFYNANKPEIKSCAEEVKATLTELGAFAWVCEGTKEDESVKSCDIVIAVGGDGTIMRCSKLALRYDKPILGINSGRVGFLAGLERNQLNNLEYLLRGKYKVTERMLLSAQIDGGLTYENIINDVVISRGARSQIVDCKIIRHDEILCSFRGDGVIVSTPTGSTAYSLSSGGPIIDSDMDCILLTPICPHSLAIRPLVLNSLVDIKVEYTVRSGSQAFITADGQTILGPTGSGVLKVKPSKERVRMISMPGDGVYRGINRKLMGKED